MKTERWELARTDGAVLWGVYDVATQEILRFEVENPGKRVMRLSITRSDRPKPKVVDCLAYSSSVRTTDMVGVGKRVPGNDEGEIDVPPGLIWKFATVPGA